MYTRDCAGAAIAMELKVIGAGCGRTGTSSLREALKILGFVPYHMEAVSYTHLTLPTICSV